MSDPYLIESLDAGLRALELFLSVDTLTVTDVAVALSIPRSRAHRILSTLERREFVSRTAGGRGYEAGRAMLSFSRQGPEASEVARTRLLADQASESLGETVHVNMLMGSRIMFSYGVAPSCDPMPVRAVNAGATRPAHATTAGKLLLSYLSAQQVRALFPTEILPRFTPWTVPTTSRLIEEVEAIRDTGIAKSFRQSLVDRAGVAVLVAGESWRDRTALVATVPMSRATDHYLDQLGRRLVQVARDRT